MAVTGRWKCALVSRMRGKARCRKENNVKMHVKEPNVIGWNEMAFPWLGPATVSVKTVGFPAS